MRAAPKRLPLHDVLRQQLDACRHAAYTVYSHLDEHGMSVGIVFRLRQLRERIVRVASCWTACSPNSPSGPLPRCWPHLAQVGLGQPQRARADRQQFAATAAKVAERSAESGEHYITRNRRRVPSHAAQGSGRRRHVGVTIWVKFLMAGLGLSAFWGGFCPA